MSALALAALLIWTAPAPASAAAPAAAPSVDLKANSALTQLSIGNNGGGAAPWSNVVCGPLLWKKLAAKEPALATKGKAEGDGRRFASSAHTDADLFKSAAMQALAKSFISATTRAPSVRERDQMASLVGRPLQNEPPVARDGVADTLLVYHEQSDLWLEISAAGSAAALAAPAASTGAVAGAAAPTVESIYTADKLRDPFQKGASGGTSSKPFTVEDFSIHNLSLRGIMKDRGSDYALFTDNSFGVSFILRRGKLYDAKGKPVPGITGSMNLKQKSAHLMTPESDVQTFQLGQEAKD